MVAWLALMATIGVQTEGAESQPNLDFRISQLPGEAVPLPTDGFSVRQVNSLWHEGKYYVYGDIIRWDNPEHPDSYGSSIGVFSSPDGRKWTYHGPVVTGGDKGAWDYGGTATPGVAEFQGKFYIAYSGREFRNGLGERYLGLAVADTPLGPFTKMPDPIFPLVGHPEQPACFDDPQLVTRPGGSKLLLYYRYARWGQREWKNGADPYAVDYSVRLRTTTDPVKGWSDPRVLFTKQPGDGALEPVEAKWINGQFVLGVLNYNPGTALYVSADGENYRRCALPNLRNHVNLYRANPAANLSGLLMDGQGKVRFVNTVGFTDTNGHFTQWICPAKSTGGSAGAKRGQDSSCEYARADLPPLMEFLDGTPVRTKGDFQRRKQEIRRLLCQHFIGSFPKKVPAIISAEILQEQKKEDGSRRRQVKLTFDTPNEASFEMWVWIPKGDGPFPLLLTQPRFYQIFWAEDAVKRGYIACLYPGLDVHHKEKDYPGYENVWRTFKDEYPNATWESSLAIQAWLGSRSLDYLLDPKYGYDVTQGQVGIIGFSRYGKQSLYAAAFDERFTSVVARSSGTPTAVAYRFAGRQTFMESIEDFPSAWARANLRAYHGRENELPIEGHGLLALIAPRHCMLHTAHNDGSDPTFGVERTYLQGRDVYHFLGKPESLRNMYRTGNHESGPAPDYVTPEHRRQNLDWFDLSFGRGTAKRADFPEVLLHQFDWNAWKEHQSPEDLRNPFSSPAAIDDDRARRIAWMLGRVPKNVEGAGQYHIRSEDELGVPSSSRDRWACADTARMPVSFSGRIHGNLYYNPTIQKPVPAVIWLHPYNYSHGSNEGYGVQDTTVYHRLARQGYVVLAYDQCGFGDRLLEGPGFYEKYPGWSRLGRMVHDVRAAVDFLVDGKGKAQGEMPAVDGKQVYVLGYSLGGMVGLYATAMDDRIRGVSSFCGFTPLRTDTDAKPTGGIRRLWQWHALEPTLGLFHGREGEIPYDFDDVLKLIAPRPCLIYSPKRDRDADFGDVSACMDRARKAWRTSGEDDALTHLAPDDINRFQQSQQDTALKWLDRVTGPKKGTAAVGKPKTAAKIGS